MDTIDSYHFGEIVINGKKYSSDVIIFPDRIRDNWFRKTGHQLCLEDITEVITENPEVLIVGTGASGLMKLLPEVEQVALAQGIKIIAESTDKACNTYNQLNRSQRVVAALHLTC
ncbi:Mth938-like domain-containing protein [Chloroflexota bacterium]